MSYEYLTESGIIVPDTSDTRQQVVSEWKQALGQDLITSDETPQGLLINAETEARQAVARTNAAVANQINPNMAEGIFLDAIWALTGGSRVKATHTQVQGVELAGVAGTLIPEGSLAKAGQHAFKTVSPATLNASGKATVNFQAIELGAIACTASTLTKIESAILGWETVNNPNEGVLGKEEESDQSARIRRKRTLALQGRALPEAIISELYSLEGVKSLVLRENISHKPAVIDGITLLPHSIWVCVDGGIDSHIATSLLNTKSLGAAYNGKVAVEVTEPISGQNYEVKFDRPEEILIYIKVTLKPNISALDPQAAARTAIMRYINGEHDGETGFIVGADVSPFELASAINRDFPGLFVKKVEISTENDHYKSDVISIGLDQIARATEGTITVVSV